MNRPGYNTSPVDHYLQANALRKLFRSEQEIPFSRLKPDGVENSLFMYHIRKLEKRGLIERSQDGFTLTPAGARWVNFVSPALQPKLTPRPLISFLITNTDRRYVLLSKRRGQGSHHLNTYLFPSGFHRYGEPLQTAANALFQTRTGIAHEPTYQGVVEMIYTLSDDYTHHIIGLFHAATLDRTLTLPHETDYAYTWAPITDVLDGQYETIPAQVMRKYLDGDLTGYSTFLSADTPA